ncbi:NAD(P)/FAD-dependent oxidoreductase [Streptomyces sp. NPDC059009]|uniref:NAD(P)/FAD-dependent oxidoreductase n=1 Tax=Streptomyces sp. NPDC059009 TaxID=3346694 RepID=UPI003693E71C
MKAVTVVGASLAGLYTARELRAQGFDGRLVVVGAEPHQPYDRPPLSKGFLMAGSGPAAGERVADGCGAEGAAFGESAADDAPPALAELALTDSEETAELDARWLLGTRATGLDPRTRSVLLDDGRALESDAVVIATGAHARRLPGPAHDLAGVHTLRTLDDARALRADLLRGPCRVVVIGGGFIGAETASSCVRLGHDVTVVEAAPLPLVPQLGPELAAVCAGLHRRGGVRLLTGVGVAALRGSAVRHGEGARAVRMESTQAVRQVELTDGRTLPADVVVIGIGASPNTAWLRGTSLVLDDGVVCDAGCLTEVPQVAAVGDVARVGGVRAEHWTSATEQPRVAVRNLLAGHTVETVSRPSYFWSDQYGSRLQFAGRRGDGATVRVMEGRSDGAGLPVLGEEGGEGFLVSYESGGAVTGVLAVDRPRGFARARRVLGRPTAVTGV